ncbi:hypothetical protein CKAH01_00754 [Colletotrichum kahawae]|uniref:Uncharacterized protein n=1 Tax=Colletotrichum kahawae TaxID=34407 RepID=A0AAE0D944_COLKA|nr:hypothetical protein CKAH01_00754 [Colletotrichum kahawae]
MDEPHGLSRAEAARAHSFLVLMTPDKLRRRSSLLRIGRCDDARCGSGSMNPTRRPPWPSLSMLLGQSSICRDGLLRVSTSGRQLFWVEEGGPRPRNLAGGPQSHRDHGDERQMAASWRREQGTSFSLPLILRVAINICRCCDYELQLAATLDSSEISTQQNQRRQRHPGTSFVGLVVPCIRAGVPATASDTTGVQHERVCMCDGSIKNGASEWSCLSRRSDTRQPAPNGEYEPKKPFMQVVWTSAAPSTRTNPHVP